MRSVRVELCAIVVRYGAVVILWLVGTGSGGGGGILEVGCGSVAMN